MNFLAHLYLSGENPNLILGNFLGDFVRNRDIASYPEAVQTGIRLHRFIDSYTDQHPMVRQGTARLRSAHRKYAPVVLDVLYDFVLVQNWEQYHALPLPDFTQQTYTHLLDGSTLAPPFLRNRVERMVADDWLRHYASLEGLRSVFERMKHRASQPGLFDQAPESLLLHYNEFEQEFNAFFPELVEQVGMFR